MSKRKSVKRPPCLHERTKTERSYTWRSDKPIEGYKPIDLVTCKACNKQLKINQVEK